MTTSMIHVESSRVIHAPAAAIYDLLREYHRGHKEVVPAPYFRNWEVLKGGIGAGTEIRFTVEVYGQQTHYHQIVSEPEPGRVLRESSVSTAQYSEFTLDPVGDGSQTRVTIFSATPASAGLKGLLERWFQPGIARSLYQKELENIARRVEKSPESARKPA